MKVTKILLESLASEKTYKVLEDLDKNGELEKIIPKIVDMKSAGECKYHVLNCFDHSLKALEELENIIGLDNGFSGHLDTHIRKYLSTPVSGQITKFHILKLGVFLHDIGKYDSKTIDETGRVHFTNHENVGAEIVKGLCTNLELDKEVSELLYKYVKHHMTLLSFYKKNSIEKKELFGIFDVLKDDVIGVIILGYADIVATRKLLNPKEDMGVVATYMEYILTNYLYRYLKN